MELTCPLLSKLESLQVELNSAHKQLEQSKKEIALLNSQSKADTEKITELTGQIKTLTAEVNQTQLAFEASKTQLTRALQERDALLKVDKLNT